MFVINQISMRSNIAQVTANFRATREQIKIATVKALNQTVNTVKNREVDEMRKVFDRPTPFTLNALSVKAANPSSLEAQVIIKDIGAYSKNQTTRRHYLYPQIEGGDRPLKQVEKYLRDCGALPPGMFAVPGAGAKMDDYGNMSKGQLIQILSALGAMPERGYLANRSRRKGARFNKHTALIFVGRPHPGWPLGVWQRSKEGLKPLLIFVSNVHYHRRFDFYGVANTVAQQIFPVIMLQEMRKATTFQALPMAA
jgi:hypothetical protein